MDRQILGFKFSLSLSFSPYICLSICFSLPIFVSFFYPSFLSLSPSFPILLSSLFLPLSLSFSYPSLSLSFPFFFSLILYVCPFSLSFYVYPSFLSLSPSNRSLSLSSRHKHSISLSPNLNIPHAVLLSVPPHHTLSPPPLSRKLQVRLSKRGINGILPHLILNVPYKIFKKEICLKTESRREQ